MRKTSANVLPSSAESPAGDPDGSVSPDRCPMVSVIIYCQSDSEVLMKTLESVERQDYPNKETIVVCDAGVDYANEVSDMVSARFSNVYVTFVQPGSHNLSRRKLANTIGFKAAKGEVVLTTMANVEIPSEKWLTCLMEPFCGPSGKHCDYSLGLTMIDFSELRGPGKWYKQFDAVLSDSLWVGYAAAGHPYRGDALNMALRRKFFFDNKGYARTNHLHNGDDDVQLRGLALSGNTKAVVSPRCILHTQWGVSANRIWKLRKSQYSFTRRWLPRAPFLRQGIMAAMQWAVPALAAGAALSGLPSLIPLICAAVILLAMWGVEIACYRRAAARLGAVRLWWAVVPFWLWHPIGNALFNFDHQGSRKKNYTWQR